MSVRAVSLFLATLLLYSGSLLAAPLESGFANAPSALASPEEKAAAYGNARSKVLAAAAKYEKTPYLYGGIDRRGMDCSGFVYASFRDALGVSIPRSTQSQYSWVEKISFENANPGDLLFFKTTGNGKISHVGIYLGNRRFIHSASEGPATGVIYSNLDERYWARTYAGVGRALPGGPVDASQYPEQKYAGPPPGGEDRSFGASNSRKGETKERIFLIGFAIAPTWGTFYSDGIVIRGAAGQFRMRWDVTPFKKPMIFGLELRPEGDWALGVFRIPLTVSWGYNDKVRFFAGPAVSFGNAALTVSGENRLYGGGTSWFGAAGLTLAPFIIKIAGNDFAPYGEFAWQSYLSNSNKMHFAADLSAGLRISTGIRYTWKK